MDRVSAAEASDQRDATQCVLQRIACMRHLRARRSAAPRAFTPAIQRLVGPGEQDLRHETRRATATALQRLQRAHARAKTKAREQARARTRGLPAWEGSGDGGVWTRSRRQRVDGPRGQVRERPEAEAGGAPMPQAQRPRLAGPKGQKRKRLTGGAGAASGSGTR